MELHSFTQVTALGRMLNQQHNPQPGSQAHPHAPQLSTPTPPRASWHWLLVPRYTDTEDATGPYRTSVLTSLRITSLESASKSMRRETPARNSLKKKKHEDVQPFHVGGSWNILLKTPLGRCHVCWASSSKCISNGFKHLPMGLTRMICCTWGPCCFKRDVSSFTPGQRTWKSNSWKDGKEHVK